MFYNNYFKQLNYLIRKYVYCFIFKDPILCNTLVQLRIMAYDYVNLIRR